MNSGKDRNKTNTTKNPEMHTVTITRNITETVRDIFEMLEIEHVIERLDDDHTSVRSRFTEQELHELVDDAYVLPHKHDSLLYYQLCKTIEGVKYYNRHYAGPDIIATEPIDYYLMDCPDAYATFSTSNVYEIFSQILDDNKKKISNWSLTEQASFLEVRAVAPDWVAAGLWVTQDWIREIQTKDMVAILYKPNSNTRKATTETAEHQIKINEIFGELFETVMIYPDITERAISARPTGRDITEDVRELSIYKKANAEMKRSIIRRIKWGITH